MAFIVPEEIEQYAAEHTTPPTDVLAALAAETRETLEAPQMLTGTIEGRFLELLVYASGAEIVPHLYWRAGRVLYTVSGPFPAATLAAVARSLEPVGG